MLFKWIENYLCLRQIRMDNINSNAVKCKFTAQLLGTLLALEENQYRRIQTLQDVAVNKKVKEGNKLKNTNRNDSGGNTTLQAFRKFQSEAKSDTAISIPSHFLYHVHDTLSNTKPRISRMFNYIQYMRHIISKTNIRLQNRKYILIVNCSDNSNFFSNRYTDRKLD